ncbi:deoxyribodipyrimidine photo-lyase [Polynucleobacter necessarius]|uniref:deoxyribodipyrimidine photo-lyase n=1 Tax=Polynucleobacter necessarius TaxID=576610 RepID=UPI000E095E4A
MTPAIYWFRNDLRIEDNPALVLACQHAGSLLPIYIHESALGAKTQWGFERVSRHRRNFLQESIEDLRSQIQALGSELVEFKGDVLEIFEKLRPQFVRANRGPRRSRAN